MLLKFSLVVSLPHQMVRFHTPGRIGTVHSDPAPIIESLIEEQKRAKDIHPFPAPNNMHIDVITGFPADDICTEVPDSDQPMEVDAEKSPGSDPVKNQEDLATSPLSQKVEKYQEMVIHADYPDKK